MTVITAGGAKLRFHASNVPSFLSYIDAVLVTTYSE